MGTRLAPEERLRLEALDRYDLEAPPDRGFDDLAMLAAHVCGAPLAFVSLVGADREWPRARFGWNGNAPDATPFSRYVLREPAPFVVRDTLTDARFAKDALVTSEPRVRFYAGSPLLSPDSCAVGVLAVMDKKPRVLDEAQCAALGVLAREIVARLELQRAEREASLREARMTAIAESEVLHRVTLANISDAVFLTDDQGRFRYVCPNVDVIFSATPEDVMALGSIDALLGSNIVSRADLAARQEVANVECEIIDSKGVRRVLLVSAKRVTIFGGTVLYTCRDISERKRAEEALRHSEELFRAIVEDQTEMIVRWKPDGTRTFVNQAYCRVFERKYEELVGENFYPVIEEKYRDEIRRKVLSLTPENPVATEVHESIGPSGKLLWQEWTDRGLFDDRGELFELQSTGRDITDRLRLEEQLRQSQKMEAIGQLAGGVAHDFNNLLATIMMSADIAARAQSIDDCRLILADIQATSERAARLTRQLLAFSRQQVMEPRLVDLNEIVTSLTRMLERIVGEDVQLELRVHPGSLVVRADPGMIDQVLMNLVVNARDAMPSGGRVVIETTQRTLDAETARERSTPPGRQVVLRVSDTGKGIAPEHLPHLFEPFFTTKAVGKGTGLGLATVFGIVKQHGGHLGVESAVGEGTVFEISLPGADVARGEVRSLEVMPTGGTETILVVEDDLAVRQLTRAVLERSGYRVLEAADGIEALVCWESHKDDIRLVFTDLVMPGALGGRELVARIHLENPRVCAVFTSGYSREIAGRELLLEEGQNFLQKPAPADVLLATVRRCLDTAPHGH